LTFPGYTTDNQGFVIYCTETLDEYVDKNCAFALKAEANGDYTDDEAVWVEAKLIR